MHCRDNQIGFIACIVCRNNPCCLGVITQNFCYFLPRQNRSAQLFNALDQHFCNDVATTGYSESTLVIKIGDESVGRKGGFTTFGGIKRQISHQHFAQQFVVNQRADNIVDATHLIFGVKHCIAFGMSQRVERRCPCNLFDERKVVVKIIFFVRKFFGQRLNKGFMTVSQLELTSQKRYNIVSGCVESGQWYGFQAQITQQIMKCLPFVGTTDKVHTGFKLCAAAFKTL